LSTLGRTKKSKHLDSDFYLADLFVDDKDTQKTDDDNTIRDNLFVIFQNQGYKMPKKTSSKCLMLLSTYATKKLSTFLETLQKTTSKRISRIHY